MATATRNRKPAFFVATRKRNEPVFVQFYTKTGKPVAFDAVEKIKTKEGVFFYAKPEKARKR